MIDEPNPIKCEVKTLVAAASGEARVELMFGDFKIQLSVGSAKEVVQLLHEGIEAAISDELIFKFFTTRMNLPREQAVMVLRDFRVLRQGTEDTVFPQRNGIVQ